MIFDLRKLAFILLAFTLACSAPEKKSEYGRLLDYEGKYEYVNHTTLNIIVSDLDTTLYAVIDKAKYPLNHIEADSFTNIQDQPVVFLRDEKGKIRGYKADGQEFNLITTSIQKAETLPRRALYHKSEDYAYKKPEQLSDGIATGSVNDEFKNSKALTAMVKETIKGNYPDVHSILIYKNNKLVLEEYFYDYNRKTTHQLRSAGKALKSGLLGIVIDKGFIKSEKEKLLPYFSSKYAEIANVDDRKQQITIENFLRYRHGMDCENNNPESAGNELKMMQSEDWVKHTLDLPMVSEPGKTSSYCTGCPLVIYNLIEVATNKKIEDFAQQHLFEPLGITDYKWTFEPNPSSANTFNQLYMKPRDVLKLAIMYKDSGRWQGQQIIPQEWVQKTFTMNEGDYGYFWEHKYFVVDGKKYNSYLASGNGGQKINIWPELDMITVFTGGNYNSYALYGKITPPNEMIPDYILKAVE